MEEMSLGSVVSDWSGLSRHHPHLQKAGQRLPVCPWDSQQDRLLSAQHSAALVVIFVDKISAECRLSALDIFDLILGCPSINVTCVSSG